MRIRRTKSVKVVPGGVDDYVAKCPKDAQDKLSTIRDAIREVTPGATETISYFQMPGYSYAGYDYNIWKQMPAVARRIKLFRPYALEFSAAEDTSQEAASETGD